MRAQENPRDRCAGQAACRWFLATDARSARKAGKAEREALVKVLYSTGYAAAQLSLPRGQYDNDDLLDAFAALWSGERVVAGEELLLPAEPSLDLCRRSGLKIRALPN
jgi:predicted RNase H-like nuclease